MQHHSFLLSTMIVLLCFSLILIPISSSATSAIDYSGTPVEFDGVLSESIASQINNASDLTANTNSRALLAAFLVLEFQFLIQNDTTGNIKLNIDNAPIFVAKSGTMASVSFDTSKGYVLIIFQSNPLSTYYAFAGYSNSDMAKKALQMSSDSVWEVNLEDFISAFNSLMGAISK